MLLAEIDNLLPSTKLKWENLIIIIILLPYKAVIAYLNITREINLSRLASVNIIEGAFSTHVASGIL